MEIVSNIVVILYFTYYNSVCGEGEIRTRERLSPLVVFKTTALGHYATSPDLILFEIRAGIEPAQ